MLLIRTTLLTLGAYWLCQFGVCAEDGEVEVGDADAGEAKGASANDAPAETDAPPETDEAKAKAYTDSASELQDKLGQLNALLEAKGGADPALKERLASLQAQLGGLGIGGDLSGGIATGEPGSSPELTEFLTGCVMLSFRRAGAQKMGTLTAIKKLADGNLTPEEAAGHEMWRFVGMCITEFTDQELESFKSGRLAVLPTAYVTMSKDTKKATEALVGIEAGIWAELKMIATKVHKEVVGNQKHDTPPIWIGIAGAIPFICVIGFLAKKFMDMQSDHNKPKKVKKDSGRNSGSKKQK